MTPDIDIQARLQQMITEDPHGKDAEALLRRMVAFQGPFNRYLMMTLAPKEMTRQARMGMLRTLLKWGFLIQRFQSNHWRFQPERVLFLNPNVIEAIDVDESVYPILLRRSQEPGPDRDPLRAYQLVYRLEWLHALREAFHRNRDQGLRFFLALSPFKRGDPSAWNTARDISLHYHSTEEQFQALLYLAVLCEEYDLPWMFYGYFNPFAERSHETRYLHTFLEQNTILSLSQEDKEVIRQFYERHASDAARQDASTVLSRLAIIKLRQDDLNGTFQYFDLAIRHHLIQQWHWEVDPLEVAQRLEQLDKPEIARFVYARLYLLRGRSVPPLWQRARYDALWEWGRMEYRLGDRTSAQGLCRIALYEWEKYITLMEQQGPNHEARRQWRRKYDELLAMEGQEADTPAPMD